MQASSEFRSKLGRVKGLGAAHHGVMHWWWQRVTAVALIPLSLWFVASLIKALLTPDVVEVAQWFALPWNALLMLLFIAAAFWHAKLGVQVVIEDYVKRPAAKYFLLLANQFLCAGLAALGVLAVLKLHFLDIIAGG